MHACVLALVLTSGVHLADGPVIIHTTDLIPSVEREAQRSRHAALVERYSYHQLGWSLGGTAATTVGAIAVLVSAAYVGSGHSHDPTAVGVMWGTIAMMGSGAGLTLFANWFFGRQAEAERAAMN